MAIDEYNQASNKLLQAVKWLCRPLVKLLIANGISYPQLREMLKALYVDVAEQDFMLNNKAPTASRLYVLTGVHRKDIKRLRQTGGQTEHAAGQSTTTLGAAIMGRWLGMAEYQDSRGEQRCLPRNSDDDSPGFDQLVATVSKDVRPRAVLDEWLRLGMVSLNDKGEVCLNRHAFVPQNLTEQAYYLGHNVHDHLAACEHNMQQQGEPMLERSVYYTGLKAASIEQLNEMVQVEAMALLHRINEQALKLQLQDKGDNEANHRMRFGCYWFDENSKASKEVTP